MKTNKQSFKKNFSQQEVMTAIQKANEVSAPGF
jgi:hypothetical protein